MRTIYLDYNLVAIIGSRTRQDAQLLEEHAMRLVANGDRIALSAWHAVELSRSRDSTHVANCIGLADRLRPIWLSNAVYVKKEELKTILAGKPDFRGLTLSANPAFNDPISQMWATYGPAFVGETFGHTVHALRDARNQELAAAIRQTPAAIRTGREAIKDGRAATMKSIIQREYFAGLVPRGAFDPNKAIDYLLAHEPEVLRSCPAIAVERHLTQIRATESFRPEEGDAADLQHATVGLAYCDHFVSDDKMLVEHCRRVAKKAGLACEVGRNLLDIPIKGPT